MSTLSRVRRSLLCALLSSAAAPATWAGGWDAVLLSPAQQGSGGAVPLALGEGETAVTALRSAVQRLPREPVGSPAWHFDLIRGGVRIDSLALSAAEASQLGEAAAPLLRAAAGPPAAFLYRVELPADSLPLLEDRESELAALGMHSFHPTAAREYWSSHELMLSAYQRAGGAAPARNPADPGQTRFEQQLRSLLQPRPLNELEEGLFQRILPELYAHYRDLTANPAIRELQVDYERQRWQTAADRRNLLILARYSVRTPRELEVIENYLAQRGAPRGTSRRPESAVMLLVATDGDPVRVREQLAALVPGVRSLRPGR